jgi:hypothetical protein
MGARRRRGGRTGTAPGPRARAADAEMTPRLGTVSLAVLAVALVLATVVLIP